MPVALLAGGGRTRTVLCQKQLRDPGSHSLYENCGLAGNDLLDLQYDSRVVDS